MSNRKLFSLALMALVLATGLTLSAAGGDEGSWTGEVVDIACYVANDAHGEKHGDCAKTCVKSGQPMGLLTAEGALVLLAADQGDTKPYEALKDLAGQQAVVMGTLAEKDGMKVVTVTGSKAAS